MWESLGGGERSYRTTRRLQLPNIGAGSITAQAAQPDSGFGDDTNRAASRRSPKTEDGGRFSDLGPRRAALPAPATASHLGDAGEIPGARLMHIESRLTATERSNRAMLEELVRWQSELKEQSRHQDELRREERRELLEVRANMASNNDDIVRLKHKMQSAEDLLTKVQLAQQNARDQIKTLQQVVIDNNQAHTARQDQICLRVERWQSEIQHTLDDIRRGDEKSQLRVANLVEEVRRIRSAQESHAVEVQSAVTEVRTNLKRCVAEQQGLTSTVSENHTKLMRLSDECGKLTPVMYEGLKQLEKMINDLRSTVADLERDERSHSTTVASKTKELEGECSKLWSKMQQRFEEADKAVADISRRLDAEKTTTSEQLRAMVDAQQKELEQLDKDIREIMGSRLQSLEEALDKERAGRVLITAECQADINARSELLQNELRERFVEVDGSLKTHRRVVDQTLRQLHESIRLNDEHIEKAQQGMERVIHAEIETRKTEDRRHADTISHMTQKFDTAASSAQQTINSLQAQIVETREKLNLQWKRELSEHQQQVDRSTTDVEARVTTMAARMSALESGSKALADQVIRDQEGTLRKQQSLVENWQQSTGMKLQELSTIAEALPSEVRELKEKILTVNTSLTSQLETERQNRLHDQHSVNQDIASKMPRVQFERLQSDLTTQMMTQDGRLTNALNQLRECENALQLSQTSIGGKINSETNARMEGTVDLNQRLAKLRGEVDFLLQQNQHRFDDALRKPVPVWPIPVPMATAPAAATGAPAAHFQDEAMDNQASTHAASSVDDQLPPRIEITDAQESPTNETKEISDPEIEDQAANQNTPSSPVPGTPVGQDPGPLEKPGSALGTPSPGRRSRIPTPTGALSRSPSPRGRSPHSPVPPGQTPSQIPRLQRTPTPMPRAGPTPPAQTPNPDEGTHDSAVPGNLPVPGDTNMADAQSEQGNVRSDSADQDPAFVNLFGQDIEPLTPGPESASTDERQPSQNDVPIEHRMVFVRPTGEEDAELAYLTINQWSVYAALKWMEWKKRFMRPIDPLRTPTPQIGYR
eukprot:scpid21853/ scgid16587/ 